jgi:hypothetical protein
MEQIDEDIARQDREEKLIPGHAASIGYFFSASFAACSETLSLRVFIASRTPERCSRTVASTVVTPPDVVLDNVPWDEEFVLEYFTNIE